jgi:hypothetical protein
MASAPRLRPPRWQPRPAPAYERADLVSIRRDETGDADSEDHEPEVLCRGAKSELECRHDLPWAFAGLDEPRQRITGGGGVERQREVHVSPRLPQHRRRGEEQPNGDARGRRATEAPAHECNAYSEQRQADEVEQLRSDDAAEHQAGAEHQIPRERVQRDVE